MKKISTDKAPAAIGPYSQGIIAGDFLFASGQIPIIPESFFIYLFSVCDIVNAFSMN